MCQVRDYLPDVDMDTVSKQLGEALLSRLGAGPVSRVSGW
jgi:hypothetical protein